MSSVIPIQQVDLVGNQWSITAKCLAKRNCMPLNMNVLCMKVALLPLSMRCKLFRSERRWISDESLYAIANMLGMSATELEGVATFYNLIYRHPVGEHVIHLCDSISCWLHDYQTIADHLKQHSQH